MTYSLTAVSELDRSFISTMHNSATFRHRIRQAALLSAFSAVFTLSACASLPSAGPDVSDIQQESQAESERRPFVLVDISVATIEALKQRPQPSLLQHFGDDTAMPDLIIGRGDGLSLTIWEAGSDPLFSPAPVSGLQASPANTARGATISEQIVGSDGCITVPFVGRVPVAGLTAVQVQTAIEQALTGKAQKPQVLVNLSRNAANTVTVVGEVTSGARVPLSPHRERLLDVLAAAGGTRAPAFETLVQLTRGDTSVALPLLRVLRDPAENVALRAGDTLVLTREPETYTAFGATGRNAQVSFEAAQVNLIEALAKAGGLLDARADPKGIFLLRFEPQAVVGLLGATAPELRGQAEVPVVYRLDLAKAGGYFLAQNFELRDRDMLYVASASSNEWQKFLQLVGLATQPVLSGVVLQNSIE